MKSILRKPAKSVYPPIVQAKIDDFINKARGSTPVLPRPRVPIDVGAGQPVQRPASPGRKPPVTYVPPTKPTPMPMLGDRPPPNIAKPRIGVNPPMPPVMPNPGNPATFSQAMKSIGMPGMKKGGKVPSASKRADGIAVKGKTRGKIV